MFQNVTKKWWENGIFPIKNNLSFLGFLANFPLQPKNQKSAFLSPCLSSSQLFLSFSLSLSVCEEEEEEEEELFTCFLCFFSPYFFGSILLFVHTVFI